MKSLTLLYVLGIPWKHNMEPYTSEVTFEIVYIRNSGKFFMHCDKKKFTFQTIHYDIGRKLIVDSR